MAITTTRTTTAALVFLGYLAIVMPLFFLSSSSSPFQGGAFAQETTLIQPQQPELKDQQGNPLTNPVTGRLAIISTTVVNSNNNSSSNSDNNSAASEPFVAMVEARSVTGITEFLEFQIAQVSQGGSTELGISWTPEEAGTYELRTFVLSSFDEPQVLSDVQKSQISVVENN